MAKTKVAPARPKAQVWSDVGTTVSLEGLADDASAIAGLAGVVQEQLDEYTSLLDGIVEKATGRSLRAPCSLADAGGDQRTLNRKSGAISYLLIMMEDKAHANELRARYLLRQRVAVA